MTLIEMLVATTMTLIIMGVVAQLFGFVGNGVSASRAALEMSAQLRVVSHALRTDLGGITVETVPPVRVDSETGYLEIIEGAGGDYKYDVNNAFDATTLVGDVDDVLMFTTQSIGKPFKGQLGSASTIIESPYAEVAWFCRAAAPAADGTTLYNLHRRQLLVMNYVGAGLFHGTTNTLVNVFPAPYSNLGAAQRAYDLSLRRVGTDAVPNGLSDLTKRENRFLHNFPGTVTAAAFPYENVVANLGDGPLSGSRAGEDIVLSNVLAFDVRVFDPNAEIKNPSTGGVAVTPGDPGYASASSFSTPVYGCYVDIGVGGASTFAIANKDPLSQLTGNIYDTWSTHYEANGLNEDEDLLVDEGSNRSDDGGLVGVADDADEQETSPPYPYPLRGIEVRIRVYEPRSRQVRQVTVRHTFVPH